MLSTGFFSDLRDMGCRSRKGNTNCILALEMNAYRIKNTGSYIAAGME
jgi:acetate kinase